MKKELEQFIAWYIPFSILTAVVTTFLFPYLTENAVKSYGDSGEISEWLGFLVFFTSAGHKLVAAVWLWKQKKKENGRFLLWSLFGFFQGLWAVAFYVALTIFNEMKSKSNEDFSSHIQSGANQSIVDNG